MVNNASIRTPRAIPIIIDGDMAGALTFDKIMGSAEIRWERFPYGIMEVIDKRSVSIAPIGSEQVIAAFGPATTA